MEKFIKNPWVLGIGTTVIGGVLLSFVMDWINKVDWLSTLKVALKFIGNAVVSFLNFELKVWWVLVILVLFFTALLIYAKILDIKQKDAPISFLSYKKDFMLGYDWEWEYQKTYDGKYTISNLHPVCDKCGMRLKRSGIYGLGMECLRCNTTKKWEERYLTDAQLLIEDNIKKRFLQNQ